jgi:hypothetical protein
MIPARRTMTGYNSNRTREAEFYPSRRFEMGISWSLCQARFFMLNIEGEIEWARKLTEVVNDRSKKDCALK